MIFSVDIYFKMWYNANILRKEALVEGKNNFSISSDEYEIPKLFLDIDYIPTELVFRGKYFPRYVWIDGEKWIANIRDGYPFYERFRKETK